MLHPCLHFVLITEREFTCVIADRLLPHNFLVVTAELFAETEDAIIVGTDVRKPLFLGIRLGSPYNSLGNTLSDIVLVFGCLGFIKLVSLGSCTF